MTRFKDKVVIVTGPALALEQARRAAFFRKAHSSSSMDGVKRSCMKPSRALMQYSHLFTREMSRMKST
jgi:hypothetical protein